MRAQSNRRFMIDPDMYHQLISKRRLGDNVSKRSDLNDVAITPGVTGSEDFLLRLPHTIWGYDLEEHTWHNLFVSGLTQVTWARDTFTRLVLPQDAKELLFAMATSPSEKNGVTQGPNRTGQLLLLHGGPGTGKTLVAETMAEMTERPLYRIRGGDLGTDPEKLEQHFRSISYMCNEWDCVVLLDDADVFLERRALQDLQRNALFLIFFRCLVYFSGTVILTTTRIGTFDEAILSRCQLVINLPSLDEASRKIIWRNLIEMAKEDEIVGSDQLGDMVNEIMEEASKGMRLNGMEIKNMVKMAKLLARSQDTPVAQRHFLAVIRNSRDFSKYLRDLNGGREEEEIARRDRVR
jgi:SpoVK/Ycf46/Vps4 family AAA+-type ATPase